MPGNSHFDLVWIGEPDQWAKDLITRLRTTDRASISVRYRSVSTFLEELDVITADVFLIDAVELLRSDEASWRKCLDGRHIRVAAIANTEDLNLSRRLLRLGCRGLLLPSLEEETLIRALQKLVRGELWFSRKTMSNLLEQSMLTDLKSKLTTREKDILRLISQGYSNQQIAKELFISRDTVRWHARGVYSKIGVHTREGAVAFASLMDLSMDS